MIIGTTVCLSITFLGIMNQCYCLGKKQNIKRNKEYYNKLMDEYSISRTYFIDRTGELPYGIMICYETLDGSKRMKMGEAAFSNLDDFTEFIESLYEGAKTYINEKGVK